MSATSKTSSVNSTLHLGLVTINEQRYIAILHFKNADGSDRPISPEMQAARTAIHKIFQEVVKDRKEEIRCVDVSGFTLLTDSTAPHSETSKKAWDAFITALNAPNLVRHTMHPQTHVELRKPLTIEEVNSVKEILKRFDIDVLDKKIDLTPEESTLLTSLKCPGLASGILQGNVREYNDLCALLFI